MRPQSFGEKPVQTNTAEAIWPGERPGIMSAALERSLVTGIYLRIIARVYNAVLLRMVCAEPIRFYRAPCAEFSASILLSRFPFLRDSYHCTAVVIEELAR